ncbi:MAG: hypothetical protein MRY83_18975 [Flavobacteriales bacterium]|nr:hypothetical protein [Flavobacteriales bacterium]
MFKVSPILLLSLFIFSTVCAQEYNPKFEIRPYIGWPNLHQNIISNTRLGGNVFHPEFVKSDDPVTTKGLGHFGLDLRLKLFKNLRLNLNTYWVRSSAEYFVRSSNGDTTKYLFELQRTKIACVPQFTYFFYNEARTIAYFNAGAGYNAKFWKANESIPDYEFDPPYNLFESFELRLGIGIQYFILTNLAVFAEAGISGAPISAGITLAFE